MKVIAKTWYYDAEEGRVESGKTWSVTKDRANELKELGLVDIVEDAKDKTFDASNVKTSEPVKSTAKTMDSNVFGDPAKIMTKVKPS